MAYTKDAAKWRNGVIPYVINENSFTSRQKGLIQDAMNHISRETGVITFRPRSGEGDYITFVEGEGCGTTLGRSGGRQKVTLGSGCFTLSSIVHELMHVIGFDHEHCRYDRDQYVQVIYDQIPRKWHSQYQKLPKVNEPYEFDYDSVMLYDGKKFCPDCGQSMIKRNGQPLRNRGEDRGLSRTDVLKIKRLYSQSNY